MLGRLFRRRPGIGSEVTVLAGPYAGSSGQITEVRANGTFRVTIDECCQPFVAAADLRVLKARSFSDRAAEAGAKIDEDPEVDLVRQRAKNSAPPPFSF